jgi:phage tail sheath protein FI
VYGFFINGGKRCYVVNTGARQPVSGGATPTGLDVLKSIDDIAIVAIPGYTDAGSYDAALSHCESLQDRVAVLDAPREVSSLDLLTKAAAVAETTDGGDSKAVADKGAKVGAAPAGLRPRGSERGYGAVYFPWIVVRDPLAPANLAKVPPSGHIAGIYARTDATRGVHKAPANETVRGALRLTYPVSTQDQARLNPKGVNCIRTFPEGILVWGARTLADGASEWRYLNVRRLFNMIEQSIVQSTRWVVFEPNDLSLWKAIRRDVGAFLRLVWRDGALMGATPEEAFFVKCDEETNPPEVVDAGQVVIVIGIAPVKPAEFVIFRIGQSASGAQTTTL